MRKTQKNIKGSLFSRLKSLNKKELDEFEAFVSSPFHNKNQKVIRLLKELKKLSPTFEGFDKQTLFKQVFGNEKSYNDATWRAFKAMLNKLLEKYLAISNFLSKPKDVEINLLESYAERGLTNSFEQLAAKLKSSFVDQQIVGVNELMYRFQFEELQYEYTTTTNNRSLNSNLQDVIKFLDHYFMATKLRYAWVALNRQKVVDADYEMGQFFEEIRLKVTERGENSLVIVQVYGALVEMLSNVEEDALYFRFKEGFVNWSKKIPFNELRQIYTVLINYCRWHSAKGNRLFNREAWTLYRAMLNQKIILVEGVLSPHHYKNIVGIALSIKEFEWAERFIEKYKSSLSNQYQENVYLYNKALLFFAQGQYQKSAEGLREIQFSDYTFIDFYYHISFRVLSIKTYYETNENEALLFALEAFRMYLVRNKEIAKNQREAYKAFVKFGKKLLSKKRGIRRSKKSLSQEIRDTPLLFQRQWLLNKAEVLELKLD